MTAVANQNGKSDGLVSGLLIGAALGAPFGGLRGAHIKQLVGGPVEGFLKDAGIQPDKPERNHLPGLHTAPAQEFLCLLAAGDDDGSGREALSRAAAHMRTLDEGSDPRSDPPNTRGRWRLAGRPLRRALDRWAEAYPWDVSDHFAPDEQSEGTGACVRALTAVLIPGVDPIDAARLTHLREAPLVAACVVAEATRLLLAVDNPRRLDVGAILEHLANHARTIEDQLRDGDAGTRWRDLKWGVPVRRFSECLAPLASLLREGNDALAEKTLVAQALDHAADMDVTHVQHGFAPVLVPWVLYRALGPLSPANALEDVVNRGGEAPVACALVGALMGARWGAAHWPDEWIAGCLALPHGRALRQSSAAPVVESWLAAEAQWLAREQALRAPLREAAKAREAHDGEPARRKKKPAEANEPLPALTDELPFAPSPQQWLEQKGDELAPWEKQRLKAERGRKRIEWKETRRELDKLRDAPDAGDDRE